MPAINELLQEGRYRINQQFTDSENSGVYEAYDTVSNTNVIVKEIPVRMNKVTTISQQETIKAAFANEATVLTQVRHESLPSVHGFFSEIGRQYLVMEPVEGSDLEEIQKLNGKPFSAEEITAWADQLLDALHYLHTFSPPVFHRAVKPQHIKMTADGKLKLLAYGIASGIASALEPGIGNPGTEQTQLHFSPLEQIWEGLDKASQKVITNSYDEKSEMLLKQPADARSDIFGLGATLYFLATGKKPVDALERSIDILEGKGDPLVSPSMLNPEIPVEISNVIMRALEIKREGRFDSASMMRQALKTSQVLISERLAAEQAEQEEALRDLEAFRAASEHSPAPNPEPEELAPAAPVVEDETERIKRQLREAEQMRILAEERAAEAERLLRERDLGIKPAAAEVAPEVRHEPPTFEPDPVEPGPLNTAVKEEPATPAPRLEPDPVPASESADLLANPFAVPARPETSSPNAPVSEPDELEIPQVHTTADPVAENILPELELFESEPEAAAAENMAADVPETAETANEPAAEFTEELDPADDAVLEANTFASPHDEAVPLVYSDEKPVAEQAAEVDNDDSISYGSDFGSEYAEPERSSFSMGLPMIGIAVLLLGIIGFGGYFLLSGNTPESGAVPPVQSAVTAEPVQPETQPEAEIVVEVPAANVADETAAEIPVEAAAEPVAVEVERRPEPREAAPARPVRQPAERPKRTEPVEKKPETPKKLTVDDLLSDS